MLTLLTESGNECTDSTEIMSKTKGFHSNLYKRHSMKIEEDCPEYLQTLSIRQLGEAISMFHVKVHECRRNAGKHLLPRKRKKSSK